MGDYNNGLLLCVNHDELFDKGFITFAKEDGKIIISNEIDKNLYDVLNLSNDIALDKTFLTDKRKEYLSSHKLK